MAALEQWPASGIPDKPGAWLMATAKRRAIDRLRRHKLAERKHAEIGRDLDSEQEVRARTPRRRARRRHRRRPAAPDLHRLPSGALDRGAGRADAAADRRPHHRRDRARFPGAGADHRAAPRPRQADADRGSAFRSRCRAAPIAPSGSRRCWRCSTWSSTRATPPPPATTGCGRSSARRRCASAASSPASRPTSRRCTASSR